MKIAFFDLDGTLREPASRGDFISNPYDQKPIHGAQQAIEKLSEDGWAIVGLTNQGGVPGYKSMQSCAEEQKRTLELFPEMAMILASIGMAGKECLIFDGGEHRRVTLHGLTKFRKPYPDMLFAGMRILGATPNSCFMVGDRTEDKGSADAAGADFYPSRFVRSGQLLREKLHKLYLIRGISGSGKSTLAREICGANQVAADDFPGLYDGGYHPELQQAAHDWCRERAEEMMREKLTPVAVHNTFCKIKYIDPYQELADKYGYRVSVIHAEGNYGNIHNVPPEALKKQKESFEPL